MIVNDIVVLAQLSFLSNLAVAENEDILIRFVNLGVSELYRRFNLSIKVETIKTNPDLSLYELRAKDVSMLLALYDMNGKELTQTDVIGAKNFDYKQINYRSFILTKPKDAFISCVYKASPPPYTSKDDVIDIPDAMADALLTYVAYIGYGTINKDNINESSAYAVKFNSACTELENQGYKIPINSENLSVYAKGFV